MIYCQLALAKLGVNKTRETMVPLIQGNIAIIGNKNTKYIFFFFASSIIYDIIRKYSDQCEVVTCKE